MDKLKAKLHDAPLSKYQEIYSDIEALINQLESMKIFIDHMRDLRSWLINDIKTGTDLDHNTTLKKMISLVDTIPVSSFDAISDMFSHVELDKPNDVVQDIFKDIINQQSTVLGLLYESWKQFHGEK